MTKVFEKDLVLEKDTVFEESIEVEGSIVGKSGERFDLTVRGDINAWNINAVDIKAGNIKVEDINAWNINAGDINAWDIKAVDIDALDISYYTVCFAYNNIKCNTIKGRRKNSKHFCLDGKIEQEAKKR